MTPENVFVVRNGPDLETFRAVPPKPALKYGKQLSRWLCGEHEHSGGPGYPSGCGAAYQELWVARHSLHVRRRRARTRRICDRWCRIKTSATWSTSPEESPTTDSLDILSTADVCVNPDKPCEMNDISTMIKIMEYMALGKPIVQFDLKEGRFSARKRPFMPTTKSSTRISQRRSSGCWTILTTRNAWVSSDARRVERELAWDYSVQTLLAAYRRALAPRTLRKALPATSASKGEGPV